MIGHYKPIILTGIHGFGASVLQEKLFFPPFSFESMFTHQMRQTWILLIISILMVIEHNKHILVIGMHSFDALDLLQNLLFSPFSLELKFISQIGQTLILVIISILLLIEYNKHILLIGMHGFDALVLQEKLLIPPFSSKSKFIHQMG